MARPRSAVASHREPFVVHPPLGQQDDQPAEDCQLPQIVGLAARLIPGQLKKASLLNYEGEPDKAYAALEEGRQLAESTPKSTSFYPRKNDVNSSLICRGHRLATMIYFCVRI